ncbi:hypothetical protein M6B38_211315 [Iris pallida]|uniref:Uncharacterized protein n=1 Tax=Iris pallida TaxID=29817 RepID=A0AAX6E498_IRIPA|nr:hypothetical protein M6B38_211315 [Iris pallida]
MTLASTYILLSMDRYLSINADINNLTLTTKKDVIRSEKNVDVENLDDFGIDLYPAPHGLLPEP